LKGKHVRLDRTQLQREGDDSPQRSQRYAVAFDAEKVPKKLPARDKCIVSFFSCEMLVALTR
jgi:hypothetical protein